MRITEYGLKNDHNSFSPGIADRVDRLVAMDDRRQRYIAAGNAKALLQLAEEYRTFAQGMPKTAAAVRKEAERIN